MKMMMNIIMKKKRKNHLQEEKGLTKKEGHPKNLIEEYLTAIIETEIEIERMKIIMKECHS